MRLKNEIFAKSLDWLIANHKVDGQKGLAQSLGISANSVSRIMTDKVEPSDDTLRKLSQVFGFNMQWLRGESQIMFASGNDSNQHDINTGVDQSSLLNALLAAKDETIYALQQQLAAKDELIQAKDDLIVGLRTQLAALRTQVDEKKISDYPFPMGVAEPDLEYKRK